MPWIEVPDFKPARTVQAKADQNRSWYSIKNAASDEAEVLLYDEIGGWYGHTADEFVAELKAITAPKMTVRVSSPGGSVFEGIAIANALRAHPADVTVQVDGIAASIASVIALAGDRLVMQPNAMFMIHDASGLCMGDAAEMVKMAELLDAISDNIASAYAAKAGGTATDWRQAMRAETWYSAEQAVAAGLADEVGKQRGQAEADGDDPQMRQTWDLTSYGYHGPEQEPAPKPEPPAAAPVSPVSLTFNLGDLFGEQLAEAFRAAVAPEPSTEPAAPEQPVESVAEAPAEEPTAAAEPLPEPEPQHDRTTDDLTWADLTANLTQPEPDTWSALVAHLTNPASPSAAADALKEAQ